MNNPDDERLRELLRNSFLEPAGGEPRDLWPRMLRRLDQRPFRVDWFDCVLAAAGGAWIAAFPHVIPSLLYHL
jgi:hypothetical protein